MTQAVGLVGWRGMVGSVLMQRMRDEGDFSFFQPVFFSTSNAGGAAPSVSLRRAHPAAPRPAGNARDHAGACGIRRQHLVRRVRAGVQVRSGLRVVRGGTGRVWSCGSAEAGRTSRRRWRGAHAAQSAKVDPPPAPDVRVPAGPPAAPTAVPPASTVHPRGG